MKTLYNSPLSAFTSLKCGGIAKELIIVESSDELLSCLRTKHIDYILGYGTNTLVSDSGLSESTVVVTRFLEPEILINGTQITASAGTWWDDVVTQSISNNLWGIELMSGIPSSVGAAIVGNIAAYGQAIAQSLVSVEVFDKSSGVSRTLSASELDFDYRRSNFSNPEFKQLVILSATFKLSESAATDLQYASAQKIADELEIKPNTLENRRTIILEARRRAGSLYEPANNTSQHHSAGSFFKNPLVAPAIAEKIMAYEENPNINQKDIASQNSIHGGNGRRISAAHVLLAAGFKRGQTWGAVRLHPDHILKLENAGDATAQQIYDVVAEIVATVKQRLGIDLEPEVRFLGSFN